MASDEIYPLFSVSNGKYHRPAALAPLERGAAWKPTRTACGITVTPLNYYLTDADADRYTGGRLAKHLCKHCAAIPKGPTVADNLAWLGYVTIQTDTRIVCGIYRIVADPHPDYPHAVAVQNIAGQVFPLDRRLAADVSDVLPTSIAIGDRYPEARGAIPKGDPS